ncbi:MAG: LacI family DNA-binding transcriptional regulator [Lachnospiraceae bacterium]|nr:LacI family DNA-binding transcriptional regulator [Lachnospiraceae bacterium]
MKKKATIQDIADALGMSRNTVSKAINNSEGLADATRERILKKAIEMDYKQFSYVGGLIAASGTVQEVVRRPSYRGEIALLTTAFLGQSHFASLMMDKVQREFSQLGYTLNTHRVRKENLREKTLPITFRKDKVRAVICVEMFDRAYDEMVCELDVPVLFVDGPAKRDGISLPVDQLYMDNTTEITRFIRKMLDQGIRRIGFIGNCDHCQSFYERYLAFRTAMLMADVPVDSRFIIRNSKPENLAETLRALPELPDLFICANDFGAFDAIEALAALGKTVPDDVMLCGFDDCAESRTSRPPLTTIHIHTQVMAFAAVQLIMSRMKEPTLDYRTIHTQTDLIERESTNRKPL